MNVEVCYPEHQIDRVFKVGLVITTWNRANYLQRSFTSLKASDLRETLIVIVDDASDQEETLSLVRTFSIPGVPIIKIFKKDRDEFNVHRSLRMGWDLLLEKYSCKYLCNLDSDALVAKEWMGLMIQLYSRLSVERGPFILTGFNAYNHIVLEHDKDYCIKKTIGGINMFFDEFIYKDIVLPSLDYLWDDKVVQLMNAKAYPMICSTPSLIQHIGKTGQWSSPKMYDISIDFIEDPNAKRIFLWLKANMNKQICSFKQSIKWLWKKILD